MPRQIWTIFLVQKWFHLLGCKTQCFQERWQQRVPTGPKSYKGRSRFQPVYAIEESAGFSGKICWRRKFDPSFNTYNVQSLDEQPKVAQKFNDAVDRANRNFESAAVRCGQAREFLCSSLFTCKEERGWEVSTNCLWESQTWRIYLCTWCKDFSIWYS